MLVFFDTEFTELGIDSRLISIGFVSENGGHEFYAELSDTHTLSDVSDFARQAVLPLLEAGKSLMTMLELAEKLKVWIEGLEEDVTLATDSISWDWPWLHEVFYEANTWPLNLAVKPFLLKQTSEFNLAVEKGFASGLRRHHALDDAKANRLACLNQS